MIPKGPLAGAVVAVIVGCGAPVAEAAPASADTSAIVTFPPGAHVAPQRHSATAMRSCSPMCWKVRSAANSKAGLRTCTNEVRTGPSNRTPTTSPSRTSAQLIPRSCWWSSSPLPVNTPKTHDPHGLGQPEPVRRAVLNRRW